MRGKFLRLLRDAGGRVYDLGVEYHKNMPSWSLLGDPTYQIWMTHTPRGTAVDNVLGLGRTMHEHVSYSGDAVLMYTHTGTHIDALSHFGLDGRIWNRFDHASHQGDLGWHKGVDMLPDSHRIMPADLEGALGRQRVSLRPGDAVFIRTGRMRVIDDRQRYMDNPSGIGLDAARWLVVSQGAMLLGSDNLSLETFPVETPDNWVPVHTCLEAEQGVAIMEVVDLEALARDRVYEFAFSGAGLTRRGASGAPMRPIALPVRPGRHRLMPRSRREFDSEQTPTVRRP
ncbi:MAG: cyclase family protein [Gammaproteobacteria bacterium]